MSEAPLVVNDREQVRTHLTFERCIPLMRECMMALSRGDTAQVLRSIVDLRDGAAFGVMAGSLGRERAFGSKLVSVFPRNRDIGRQSHQGIVALFDPASGSPRCIIHAGEVTAIRTAAASAAATDVLARSDSSVLAVLGCGEQAWSHVQAIICVRPLSEVLIWGRSARAAADFAARVRDALNMKATACTQVADAVAAADIICTTTAAVEPILRSASVRDGTHINAVGSSRAGPVEIDSDLVVRAHIFADHRESVLRQGAEFLRAKAAGLIDDAHLRGEIGEVMLGSIEGRTSPGEVTVYKSLGNIVQDLACGEFLYTAALRDGFGARAPLE